MFQKDRLSIGQLVRTKEIVFQKDRLSIGQLAECKILGRQAELVRTKAIGKRSQAEQKKLCRRCSRLFKRLQRQFEEPETKEKQMTVKRAYLQREKDQVVNLLKTKRLGFDADIDATFYIEENNAVAATLSVAGNVIKAVAVSDKFQGQNLTAVLVNHALQHLHEKGIWKIFVFTKPENMEIFSSLSFCLIAQTRHAALLENSVMGIGKELGVLAATLPDCKNRSCIVANLNPITVGHKYLIAHAAQRSEQLIVFVVEENKSAFDFSFRFDLAVNELKDIKNVFVLPSTQYLISSATFPSYFLKEGSDADEIYSGLDAKIFHSHFVPAFDIARRYVGTEPNCVTTTKYNAALKQEMSGMVEIVDRLKVGGEAVSASRVRELLKQNRRDEIKPLVGQYTFDRLLEYAK